MKRDKEPDNTISAILLSVLAIAALVFLFTAIEDQTRHPPSAAERLHQRRDAWWNTPGFMAGPYPQADDKPPPPLLERGRPKTRGR